MADRCEWADQMMLINGKVVGFGRCKEDAEYVANPTVPDRDFKLCKKHYEKIMGAD